MEKVRAVDVIIYTKNGMDYVAGCSGGVSTFESPNPNLNGIWWELAANSTYDDTILHLVKRAEDGEDDHWIWEPEHDMPRSRFEAVLASLNGKFIIVP